MTALAWSEALALKQPRMDETHREFIDLLQGLSAALQTGVDDLDPLLAGLIAHTEAHFAQEERWMAAVGFAPENCHAMQHAQVLRALRQVRELRAEADHRATVAMLVDELARWFVAHAQMMDAALAEHMLACGYDPDTGHSVRSRAGATAITGCGSTRCS